MNYLNRCWVVCNLLMAVSLVTLQPVAALAQASGAPPVGVPTEDLGAASASAADDAGTLRRLLIEPSVQQMMMVAAKQSGVVTNNPCPDAEFKFGSMIAVIKPLQVDRTGKLTAGFVRVPINQTGCGVTRVLNVLVFVKPDQTIGAAQGIPGTSHADPLLQRDAISGVLSVAGAVSGEPNATCKTLYIANTEYLGTEGNAAEGVTVQPWGEMWTVGTCTKRTVVPVHFKPDKTGTSFTSGPMNLVKSLPAN